MIVKGLSSGFYQPSTDIKWIPLVSVCKSYHYTIILAVLLLLFCGTSYSYSCLYTQLNHIIIAL